MWSARLAIKKKVTRALTAVPSPYPCADNRPIVLLMRSQDGNTSDWPNIKGTTFSAGVRPRTLLFKPLLIGSVADRCFPAPRRTGQAAMPVQSNRPRVLRATPKSYASKIRSPSGRRTGFIPLYRSGNSQSPGWPALLRNQLPPVTALSFAVPPVQVQHEKFPCSTSDTVHTPGRQRMVKFPCGSSTVDRHNPYTCFCHQISMHS